MGLGCIGVHKHKRVDLIFKKWRITGSCNNSPSLATDNLSKVGSFHPIEIGEKGSSHNHVFKYKVVSTLNRVALIIRILIDHE